MSLTACKEPKVVDARGIRLPSSPAFMEPVAMQKFRKSQDAREALAKERGALKEANSRLIRSKKWYNNLRNNFK